MVGVAVEGRPEVRGSAMGRRQRTVLVVASALVLATMAVPAAAQANVDDFRVGGFTLAECVVAVAAASGEQLDAEQMAALQDLSDDLALDEAVALVFPGRPGFTLDDLPDGLSLEEICTIYGADTLPGVGDRDVDTDVVTIVDGRPTTPREVLGGTPRRPLALTGTDLLVLVLAGVVLLGLGFLALRRTRPQIS
jgi:hypothetical protein